MLVHEQATSQLKTMCITREGFEALFGPLGLFVVRHTLRKVSIFSALSDDQLDLLREHMTEKMFAVGETVFEQGDQGDAFYVVIMGAALVLRREQGADESTLIAEIGENGTDSFFGERALLKNETRYATIAAKTPLTTYWISRDRFESVLGPLSLLVGRY